MDLFPDGGFVRLRSRARDKYVHADEDATSVSLRPLGAVVASGDVAWEVKLCPVEGVIFVLLQGATNGRYLAASDEDEPSPFGHRGVRAVQRHSDSPHLEVSFRWLAIRVEAGQNYVQLHNTQGCLRANRKHRRWSNNLVTVEVMNGNDTMMRQWRVEAIPSTPEALPLTPPPQPPGSCCGCGREGSGGLCRRCAVRFRDTLLGGAKDRLNEDKQPGLRHCYCLECREFFTGSHSVHKEKRILLGWYKNQSVAWSDGEEAWRPIFERIETAGPAAKTYQLYESDDPRCPVCEDIVSRVLISGGRTCSLCSLNCFVTGGGGEEANVEAVIIATEYSPATTGFCLTCATPVMRFEGGQLHRGHDCLGVRTDPAGLRPRLVIPHGHPKEKDWACIGAEGPGGREVLIRDDSTVRCKECSKRLANAGDSCSLECSLAATTKGPRFLPRVLQLKSLGAKIGKTPAA